MILLYVVVPGPLGTLANLHRISHLPGYKQTHYLVTMSAGALLTPLRRFNLSAAS